MKIMYGNMMMVLSMILVYSITMIRIVYQLNQVTLLIIVLYVRRVITLIKMTIVSRYRSNNVKVLMMVLSSLEIIILL